MTGKSECRPIIDNGWVTILDGEIQVGPIIDNRRVKILSTGKSKLDPSSIINPGGENR